MATRSKSGPALGGTDYGVPADAISVPADSASEIVKFTIRYLVSRAPMRRRSIVVV